MQNSPTESKMAPLAKALEDLQELTRALRNFYEETGNSIDDDNTTFHQFCSKLEYLLYQGTKDKAGFFGSKKRSPFDFLFTVLAKTKSAKEGLRYVRYNTEVRTSAGKLRCLVRYCLFHQSLADTLQCCVLEHSAVGEYYDVSSVFASEKLSGAFVSALYELTEVQFDLAPAGFDLDRGWPTFAKRQFSGSSWPTPSSVYSSPASQGNGSLSSDVTSPRFLRRNLFSRSVSECESLKMDSSSTTGSSGMEQQQIEQLTQSNCQLEEQLKLVTQQLEQAERDVQKAEAQLEQAQNAHNLELTKLQHQVEELQQQLQLNETLQQRAAALETQVSSLREAGALCKRLLSIRENEVVLLKEQLVNTELKVTAFKERYKAKKLLLLQEEETLRQKAEQLEQQVELWNTFVELCSVAEFQDELEQQELPESQAAPKLKERVQQLLKERKQLQDQVLSLKDTMLQHENRLSTVTSELDNTWHWLSKLKLQHGQLQSEEVVLRYELKEKRQLLDRLKQQLETSRRKWDMARQQNTETQQQWQSMRQELDSRKATGSQAAEPFVPPIDLVSDIAIKEEKNPLDEREERLQLLEEQCKLLYSKLMSSTSRNAALLGKLVSIHEQHSSTDNDKGARAANQAEEKQNAGQHEAAGNVEIQSEIPQCNGQSSDSTANQLEAAREEVKSLKFQLAAQKLEFERSSQALEQQHRGLEDALRKQNEYQQLIQQLQQELLAVTSVAKEESCKYQNELGNLQLALMTREEECQGLSDELRATVAEKDEMHVEIDRLKAELQELRQSTAQTQDQLQKELAALKDESQQLRCKVVTLIKEKDALWHRSDRLLQWHRILESDKWVPDQQVDKCQACTAVFTFTLRRHHCRLCGRIFCYSCANVWLKTPGHRRKVRICNECYIIHNDAVGVENNCNFHSHSSESSERETITDSGLGGTQEAGDQSETPAPQESIPPASNGSVAIETNTYERLCQEFTVISDEEIIKSLGESSPYTRSPLAGTDYKNLWVVPVRSVESLEDMAETEVYLNAAMIYRIPIEIPRGGFLLKWKAKTIPKSIVVSVLQSVQSAQPEAAEGIAVEEGGVELVPLSRTTVKSRPDFTEGDELVATAGTYYFDLDNSHSKFLAKKVTFGLSVQPTTETTPN